MKKLLLVALIISSFLISQSLTKGWYNDDFEVPGKLTTDELEVLGGTPGIGKVLTDDGTGAGIAVWAAPTGGFADPMTTRGDIIYRNPANTTARLGLGANLFVLGSDGTDVSWTDISGIYQPLDGALTNISGLVYASPSFIKLTADDTYAVRTLAEVKQDLGIDNVSNVGTDDTAYNTTSWNANTDASTKNAIRDKIETMGTAIGLNTAKADAPSGSNNEILTDDGAGEIVSESQLLYDGTDLQLGASIDDVQPTFKIVGDADSDAGDDVSETFSITIIPAANPNNAVIQFNNTQALGYNFANGDVGIGTVNPSVKLEVSGKVLIDDNTAEPININRSGSTNIAYKVTNGDGSWYWGKASNGNFAIDINADISALALFVIKTTGEVGIGEIAPDSKLEVNGTFHVTGASTLDDNLTVSGTTVNMVTSGTTLTIGVGVDNGTVSAGIFTDRTPFFDGDGLLAIKNIIGIDGQINHESLPLFVQAKDGTERNIGNMISVNVRALQQLIAINEDLTQRIEILEAQ